MQHLFVYTHHIMTISVFKKMYLVNFSGVGVNNRNDDKIRIGQDHWGLILNVTNMEWKLKIFLVILTRDVN